MFLQVYPCNGLYSKREKSLMMHIGLRHPTHPTSSGTEHPWPLEDSQMIHLYSLVSQLHEWALSWSLEGTLASRQARLFYPQPGPVISLFAWCENEKGRLEEPKVIERIRTTTCGVAHSYTLQSPHSYFRFWHQSLQSFTILCSMSAAHCTVEYQSYLNLQENSCRWHNLSCRTTVYIHK